MKKLTREKLLDIVSEPDETCPDINEVIKITKSIVSKLNNIRLECIRAYNPEPKELLDKISEMYDEAYDLNYVIEPLEKLRHCNMNIREWGIEWRRLAIKLLNKYKPNWQDESEEEK
jgi:hypothetical protein